MDAKLSWEIPTGYARLGRSDLVVSRVGFGCWPIAGITSLVGSDSQSIAAIQAAIETGINFFDTAYSYGYSGQSDELLRRALIGRRDQTIIASKVGMHWRRDYTESSESSPAGYSRILDARPQTLIDHAQQILKRLNVEYVDLMYLHTPDGQTPIEESAAAIQSIVDRGWARYAGISNVTADEAKRFHNVCPVVVIQPYFNMLQREVVTNLREFCDQQQISLVCFWVLMKGLLAGHLKRNHQFDPRDRRLTYDIFKGIAWQRNQDLVDRLREIAVRVDCSVSQLVIAWTLAQPNITVALAGAKHPAQVMENVVGMRLELAPSILAEIDGCIAQRELAG